MIHEKRVLSGPPPEHVISKQGYILTCMHFAFLSRTLTLGLVLLVVPFLPASNIFFRVGFVIAERVLYLSSAGYCLLLAYSLGHCCCRWTKFRVGRFHIVLLNSELRPLLTAEIQSRHFSVSTAELGHIIVAFI